MNKEIKCEHCGEKYIPRKEFNPIFAFAWCPKCLNDYKREINFGLKRAIRKHLESDFNNSYKREKFAWGLVK